MLTVAIALASFHILLGASPFRTTEAESQPHPQDVIVQQLLSGNAAQQRKALESLKGLEGGELSAEIKNAMATALQQESRRHVQRY